MYINSFFQPRTDPEIVRTLVRRLLFEIGSYGPWITSATFTAIGRLSHLGPSIDSMSSRLLEEVPHPRLAMAGFVGLGGDADEAARGKLSPAAYSVAAVCRHIAEVEHPAAYFGYMYLLESTTVTLGVRVRELLESVKLKDKFITVHSKVDVKHTQDIAIDLDSVVEDLPEARGAISDSYDRFAAVYPLPIWNAAFDATTRELG